LTRIEAIQTGRPAARVPAGAELSVLPEGHALTAHQRVWVNIRQQGQLVGSVPVWFSVRALGPVLVTERSHRSHESLDRSTLRFEERDIAALIDLPLDRDADLELLRTRHAMTAGHVLLRRDVEERPPILAGEDVTVQVTYRSIAIETRGVALKEGRVGEPIALKNPDSAQTYSARVTGPHRAEVIEQ
jgi:flagella basal body P-ring formation protein FlgA